MEKKIELVKAVLEKIKYRELCGIALVFSLVLTFLPGEIISYMGLNSFRDKYHQYISLILVVAVSCYIFEGISCLIKCLRMNVIVLKCKMYLQKTISEDEKELLVYAFYDFNKKCFNASGYIEMYDGRSTSLIQNRVLYRSSSVSDNVMRFSYNLYPYALKTLNANLKRGKIVIVSDGYVVKTR